jgi:hypothetical protein
VSDRDGGCRFAFESETLDRLPDLGGDPEAIALTRSLLEQLSGDQMAIPDVRSSGDLDLLHTIAFNIPAVGDRDGWNLHFGRELNASDDRRYFDGDSPGMPVVEGKQISPFHVDTQAVRFRIAARTAARLVDPVRTFLRARLAYREVASATNRMTLIAAIVPRARSPHTVFCLKESIDDESQLFVCGMLNSFVANYLVRLRVSTHVTAGIIDRLPVPRPLRNDSDFRDRRAQPHAPSHAVGLCGDGPAAGSRGSLVRTRPSAIPARPRHVSARPARGSRPSPDGLLRYSLLIPRKALQRTEPS